MGEITEQQIDQWIEAHKDEMIEEVKLWVSQPSVSRADLYAPGAPYGPDCRKMLDLALSEGRRFGFETKEYEGYTGAIFSGAGEGKEEIGFVCHLDVVPEGDHWIYEPYHPVLEKGFLIGRGVGDNKGSAVLCLFLMRFFKENNIELKHALRLMLGCAEETGMADFKYYKEVLKESFPKVGIVADAAFPVCYAQKGGYDGAFDIPAGANIIDFTAGVVRNSIPDTAELVVSGVDAERAKEILKDFEKVDVAADGEDVRLIAHGKAGHAAFPVPGVKNNAIVLLADAAVVLEKEAGIDLNGVRFLSEAFATAFGDGLEINYQDKESGALTCNPGVIRKKNDLLHLEIDIRYPVTQRAEEITENINAAAIKYGVKFIPEAIASPYYIDPEDVKVRAMLDAYREVTGDYDAKPYSMGGGTYSRVVPNAISFGPGLFKGHKADFLPAGHGAAHGPDETLNIEDWLTGFKIYIQSVIKLDQVL